MAEIDYQRLLDLAASEGKLPTSFVLDRLKIILSKEAPKAIKRPVERFEVKSHAHVLPVMENRLAVPLIVSNPAKMAQVAKPLSPAQLAAQQKRDRKAAKRGK